ncbi:GntR family transcriptional regulator [Novosphingobium sp. Leaf2]|uniref:GntR family transcriptional regulator n=1 Tax=Novosphingobium sp. Leaf2 TaxID=1735670 RepID=UPI0006F4503C|nr:GntR family transcriptional regulator [Novosphingobium sp. Leaf2]KQM20789.1 GntR family transcriptional regulator [Novosphingobium sp. Leaf2]
MTGSNPPLTKFERANPLFHAIVGADRPGNKAACAIAAGIEADLIAKGWPTGAIYGSESQLAHQFGVCRIVLREAVRILESRGTAGMRRGPHGGLVVLGPDLVAVLEAIHRYVTSHRGADLQGSICRDVLHKTCARLDEGRSEAPISAEMVEFLDCLRAAVDHYAREGAEGRIPMGAATKSARSRAEQVFRMLLKDMSGRHTSAYRLGSEMDLCERYSADRSALRQAVRVLEFEGIAASVAGRGKGLVTRSAEPTALCQLINCHFASVGVSPADAMAVFKLLSIEVVSIAARTATEEHRRNLIAAHRTLSASGDNVSARVMQMTEESQFDIVPEPLIDVLLRCTKSYSSWRSAIRDPDSQVLGALYRTETLRVISAILDRDPVAAAAAQATKVDSLAALI